MFISHRIVRHLMSSSSLQHYYYKTNIAPRCFASSSSSSMITDMIQKLRWKAAEALTSTLNDDERSQLLKQLDAVDRTEMRTQLNEKNIEDKLSTEKTIGEAIVAARIEEAQKQESSWAKEKEKLLHDAELATRDRIANILSIQKRRIENEYAKIDKERRIGKEEQSEQSSHPILGKVITDFGYKRIYQVPAKALVSIPVWKKQRLYRHDRAKVIVKDKLKTPHLGLPGIIVLHEDKDGKLSILDGQHRVGALALLLERDEKIFDLDNILVELYTSTTDAGDNMKHDYSEEIFIEINKSEPIKLVDMPGIATAKDRTMITTAASKLQDEYVEMFKPSTKCRSPHMNVDNLRDALFASDVIQRHNITSSSALLLWMKEQNEVLRMKYNTDIAEGAINEKALSKAKEYQFYLGLESSWLYH